MISVINTLGASNLSVGTRADMDFYATPPYVVEQLLGLEKFSCNIWEPACGDGHISNALINNGFNVRSSDIIERNFPCEVLDFLNTKDEFNCDIITNPPYKQALDFVVTALDYATTGNKIAMLLPLRFLETKARRYMFDRTPPVRVWVSTSRITCAKDADFEKAKGANALAYAWFIWVKGDYSGCKLGWFN